MEYELGQKLDIMLEQNNEMIRLLGLIVAKYYPQQVKKNGTSTAAV